MPMPGAGDSAKQKALAGLNSVGAGGAVPGAPQSPYRIPVRSDRGSYGKPVNRGQFDDNVKTTGPGVREKQDLSSTDYFTVDDNGVQAAIGSWYAFDDGQRDALMKRMWFLGLVKTPTDFDGAYKVWQAAVGHAAQFASVGKEIDPRDVLDMLADPQAGANGGQYKQQGPTTSRSIDLTDPETARNWVQQAFQQSMGRKAEDAEVRALVEALHSQQQSNPTVTTNTPTKWDENGNAIDSTTTRTGGVDPDAFFAQQVAADPEAGAHQAASQLFPALMQALQAGG